MRSASSRAMMETGGNSFPVTPSKLDYGQYDVLQRSHSVSITNSVSHMHNLNESIQKQQQRQMTNRSLPPARKNLTRFRCSGALSI